MRHNSKVLFLILIVLCFGIFSSSISYAGAFDNLVIRFEHALINDTCRLYISDENGRDYEVKEDGDGWSININGQDYHIKSASFSLNDRLCATAQKNQNYIYDVPDLEEDESDQAGPSKVLLIDRIDSCFDLRYFSGKFPHDAIHRGSYEEAQEYIQKDPALKAELEEFLSFYEGLIPQYTDSNGEINENLGKTNLKGKLDLVYLDENGVEQSVSLYTNEWSEDPLYAVTGISFPTMYDEYSKYKDVSEGTFEWDARRK